MEVTRIPKKTVSLLEPKKVFSAEYTKYLKKRVAAYCRVSTDSEEQQTSYENQKRVYSKMSSKSVIESFSANNVFVS